MTKFALPPVAVAATTAAAVATAVAAVTAAAAQLLVERVLLQEMLQVRHIVIAAVDAGIGVLGEVPSTSQNPRARSGGRPRAAPVRLEPKEWPKGHH